jgi:hypothetical protein
MKTLRKLIEMLAAIETGIIRRRSANCAARAAFRIALNRCRV